MLPIIDCTAAGAPVETRGNFLVTARTGERIAGFALEEDARKFALGGYVFVPEDGAPDTLERRTRWNGPADRPSVKPGAGIIGMVASALETAAARERTAAATHKIKAGQGEDAAHHEGAAVECERVAMTFDAARVALESMRMSEATRDAIRARVLEGRDGGGFVEAVAAGDFGRAYGAADARNRAAFSEIVEFRLTLPASPVALK